MFRQANRIPRETLISLISEQKPIANNYFSVKIAENDALIPRFAVIVPKKTVKTAVGRHFLKRRAVEIIKEAVKKMPEKFSNRDFVFLVKTESNKLSKEEFKNILQEFLNYLISQNII